MQNGWPVTLRGLVVVVLSSCGLSRCLAIVARFALPVAKGGKVECWAKSAIAECGSRLGAVAVPGPWTLEAGPGRMD
ncbi:hypothetical protein GE21DRAFT_1285107 [Neurospora crassa]|nr:hypothetical protein GE21DRAFT_1285107 [Neurospora crassa]